MDAKELLAADNAEDAAKNKFTTDRTDDADLK